MPIYPGSNGNDDFWLPSNTTETVTLTGGGGTDTIYIPRGVVTYLTSGYESAMGSTIDLSNLYDTNDTIQYGTGSYTDDSSGIVVGGRVEIVSSYRLVITDESAIENLVGHSGSDSLRGNGLANILYGGDYYDTLDGMDGNDTIYGGSGVADPNDEGDIIHGGWGSDLIYGNAGNDFIYAGRGEADAGDSADLVFGGLGGDWIYGNAGDDTVYGGGSGYDPGDNLDYLYGGGGNDLLYGNGGDDVLAGQTGDDRLHGGRGNDTHAIGHGEGRDMILYFEGAGSAGGDVIQLAANINGSGMASLAGVLAHSQFAEGNAVIDLGGGNSLTVLGVTGFGADDFTFV